MGPTAYLPLYEVRYCLTRSCSKSPISCCLPGLSRTLQCPSPLSTPAGYPTEQLSPRWRWEGAQRASSTFAILHDHGVRRGQVRAVLRVWHQLGYVPHLHDGWNKFQTRQLHRGDFSSRLSS